MSWQQTSIPQVGLEEKVQEKPSSWRVYHLTRAEVLISATDCQVDPVLGSMNF